MKRSSSSATNDFDRGLLGPPPTAYQAAAVVVGCLATAIAVPPVAATLDAELGVVLGYIIDACLIGAVVPFALRHELRRRYGATPDLRKVFLAYVPFGLPLNLAVSIATLHGLMGYPGFGSRSLDLIATPAVTAIGVTVLMLSLYAHVRRRHKLLASAHGHVQAARQAASEASIAKQLLQARLTTLQAQIEPHFLYNTLANVQYLIPERPDDAERMLVSLIRYLRQSLPNLRNEGSTLGQEFELSRAYLEIARIRQGERLSIDLRLPDNLRPLPFPPLLIQTLVENALKHGVERKPGPVSLQISAKVEGTSLIVSVVDDGAGFQPGSGGTGVGLKNTRERLVALFGPDARLLLKPHQPSGVIADLVVPVDRLDHPTVSSSN